MEIKRRKGYDGTIQIHYSTIDDWMPIVGPIVFGVYTALFRAAPGNYHHDGKDVEWRDIFKQLHMEYKMFVYAMWVLNDIGFITVDKFDEDIEKMPDVVHLTIHTPPTLPKTIRPEWKRLANLLDAKN